MGKTIIADALDNQYIVTGIFGEIPYNTRLQPEVVIPIQSHPQYEGVAGNWGSSFLETYLLLKEGTSLPELEAKFESFIARIWDKETAGNTNFRMLNLLDVYNRFNDNRPFAYILLTVAFVIVAIAAINFMNLAF